VSRYAREIGISNIFIFHLNSDFRQVDLHGELFPAVDIGVVRLLEGALQLVQLIRRECRTVPPVLLLAAVPGILNIYSKGFKFQ
jgi:hypothetical protein